MARNVTAEMHASTTQEKRQRAKVGEKKRDGGIGDIRNKGPAPAASLVALSCAPMITHITVTDVENTAGTRRQA